MIETRLENGKFLAEAIRIRHDLHAHPELGYQEHRTSSIVQQELAKAGIEYVAGLAGGTGVLARIPATELEARTVALRADMDALPIHEESGVSYSSTTPGKMHACGHDGHTTILLTAAKQLMETPYRPNEILLVFQPAEEGGAGGKRMREDGVLTGAVLGNPVDVIFGLHGHPDTPVGQIATRVGPILASATQLNIKIHGKGAHAAQPHNSIDPIVVASHIVTALQTVASRTVDPLEAVVVTIGKIEAGKAHNVIPETAILSGTLRTLNDKTADLAKSRIQQIVTMIAQAFGATAELVWESTPYPVTFNDPDATERVRAVAAEVIGAESVLEMAKPMMGGEDFSFYGQHVPASFFFLGLCNPNGPAYPGLHSPFFDFNDEAIPVGVELMTSLALKKL